MKRSKGFTLIELLTVIAILAIILLIAAPTILGVLEKSKKNNFKNQVLLYVEGLKQKVALSAIEEGNITLPDDGESIEVDVSTITLETDKGYTGIIKVTNDNGKYKYEVINVTGDGYTANGPVNNITVTKEGEVTESPTPEPTPIYTAYTIGQQVTLKDNTIWYVIKDSNSSSETVTLFASQNIKKNASGWTTNRDEYRMPFDGANARTTEKNSYCIQSTYGCNIYAAQEGIVTNGDISGTVTEDSSIKKFLEGSVTNYINNSLTSSGGTTIKDIRLITVDEICNIINASDSSNDCKLSTAFYSSNNGYKALPQVFNNVPSWLYSTPYWTMTPDVSNSYQVYDNTSGGVLNRYYTYSDNGIGTRPVIETNKSNIK